MFKNYIYAGFKKEIRNLLRKRLQIKEKINYYKIRLIEFEEKVLPQIEKELEEFLKKAGN